MEPFDQVEPHIHEGRQVIGKLLNAERLGFQDLTPSKLPDKPGIYVISHRQTGEVLRAGRTDDQSLRVRVYRNHLMGSQKGNIRAQLVRSGVCKNLEEAKQWVRDNCAVQFLEKHDLEIGMRWAEYFLLALLRPRFCD